MSLSLKGSPPVMSFFTPGDTVCVDESMIRWYGLGGSWINMGLPTFVPDSPMYTFAKGTNAIAKVVSEMTQNEGTSIIGGGDSASAIKDLGVWDDMTHISTGGGASLELLSGEDLPAFKALRMI